jgi:hypothetical protein
MIQPYMHACECQLVYAMQLGNIINRLHRTRLHLTPDFPSANLLTRNPTGEGVRALYVTNDLVKGVVNYNDYTRLRLTTAGTKVTSPEKKPRPQYTTNYYIPRSLPDKKLGVVQTPSSACSARACLSSCLSSNRIQLSTLQTLEFSRA